MRRIGVAGIAWVVLGCGGEGEGVGVGVGEDVGEVEAVSEVEAETETETEAETETVIETWSPLELPGLVLFLDAGDGIVAHDGLVETWTSADPAGVAPTQPDVGLRPRLVPEVFGDRPALRFDGTRYLMIAAPVSLPTGSSIFAVAAWTETSADPLGNIADVPQTIVGDGTNGYGAFGAAGDAIASNHYVGGPVTVTRGAGLDDGKARLIGATVDARTVARIYAGNTQLGADAHSAPLAGANSWDTIGAGFGGLDGWRGDLGAVVIVTGEIARADRTKLDLWAQQRFGTPVSPPLDRYERVILGEMPLEPDLWHPRDGSQLARLGSGRVLQLGGWSPYDPWLWEGEGQRVTNEIWASDDDGAHWRLHLPHTRDATRFAPGHTVGVTTYRGRAVVIGSDCLTPPYHGEVWHSDDDGLVWTRVATDAPSLGRCLFMVGSLGDDIYLMGGQTNLYDPATGIADVWRSPDGGVTWIELEAPPWAARGMVYRPAELDGRLFIAGGGLYADAAIPAIAFNGVYAFDGENWKTVRPDGHAQWQSSYYNALAALDGRLWLLNGFTGEVELSRALVSDDQGLTWQELPGGSGGEPSHADAVIALDDRILRISGNLSERLVYAYMLSR